MVRRFKKANTSMSIQRAQQDIAASTAQADQDLLRAQRKGAEADVLIAELRSHSERLDDLVFTLLGGEGR